MKPFTHLLPTPKTPPYVTTQAALDSQLLSGKLDVDDYATTLLRQHSLENALKTIEQLTKERNELKAQLMNKNNNDGGGPPPPPHTNGDDNRPPLEIMLASRSVIPDPCRRFLSSQLQWHDQDMEDQQWYHDTFQSDISSTLPTTKSSTLPMEEMVEDRLKELSALKLKLEQEHARILIEQQQHQHHTTNNNNDDMARLQLQSAAFEEFKRNATQRMDQLKLDLDHERHIRKRAHEIAVRLLEHTRARHIFGQWFALVRKHAMTRKRDLELFRIRPLRQTFMAWRHVAHAICLARVRMNRTLQHTLLTAWIAHHRRSNRLTHLLDVFTARSNGKLKLSIFTAWRQIASMRAQRLFGSDMDVATLRNSAARQKIPALILASSRGNVNAVIELINEGSAVNLRARKTGVTPLHAAATAASADVTEILLEHGANPSVTDDQGEYPLLTAAKVGDAAVGVVLALLRHGSDPNTAYAADGKTALHVAAQGGALKIAQTLLQYHARADAQTTTTGWTPLHEASLRADVTMIQLLMGTEETPPHHFGASFPRDLQRKTPLHAASSSQMLDMPRAIDLLLRCGFDVNAKSLLSETPLMIFAQNPNAHAETLTIFTRFEVELDMQDTNGNTALHYACQQDNRELCKALVNQGAPLFLINNQNESPLDLVSPMVAIILLSCITRPPYLARAERAHRGLNHCQICKKKLDINIFKHKMADHCRRCGRLCCLTCVEHKARLMWEMPSTTTSTTDDRGGMLAQTPPHHHGGGFVAGMGSKLSNGVTMAGNLVVGSGAAAAAAAAAVVSGGALSNTNSVHHYSTEVNVCNHCADLLQLKTDPQIAQ